VTADQYIVAFAVVCSPMIFGGCLDRPVEPEPQTVVKPVPFAEAFKCPPHAPGLSRTLVVYADEDEAGVITGLSCMRMRERGKSGVAL